jgi:hypothetical protein
VTAGVSGGLAGALPHLNLGAPPTGTAFEFRDVWVRVLSCLVDAVDFEGD